MISVTPRLVSGSPDATMSPDVQAKARGMNPILPATLRVQRIVAAIQTSMAEVSSKGVVDMLVACSNVLELTSKWMNSPPKKLRISMSWWRRILCLLLGINPRSPFSGV